MNQVIGSLIPNRPVHIWGAGFSGLVLAYYLKKAGYEVTLYEKSERVGGKIGTQQSIYGTIEIGANALYLSADALELVDELKIEPLPSSPRIRRFIFQNKKFKSPISLRLIFRLILGWFRPTPIRTDRLTVEDFFLPLLGQKLVDQLLSPALSGIYASEAKYLDFESLFPEEFAVYPQTYGQFIKLVKQRSQKTIGMRVKGSVSFQGGMQILINALENLLKGNIKLNYQGEFLMRENTILTTDARTAGEILESKFPEVSGKLKKIEYKKLSTTTIFMHNRIPELENSFGVLIPRDQKLHCLGVLHNSAIFPSNYQAHASYTFISPEIDDLKTKIISDLQVLAPKIKQTDFILAETKLWPVALPVYNLARKNAVNELHKLTKESPGLILFGNYAAGISLREMITAAKKFSIS